MILLKKVLGTELFNIQPKESRNSSRCESPSRHKESSHVHMPHRNDPSHNRLSAYNDFVHHRSSHRSPSQSSTRKSSLRYDYRRRTKRTPNESPTRESRHSHRHTKYHTPSHHPRTGERHQESRKFHSRHGGLCIFLHI